MPKRFTNQTEATFFHVLVQGINKEYIFNSFKEMKEYKKLIFLLSQKYNVKIIAYCIMNNHVHMLINTPKVESLSLFMHRVNTIYAKYYNCNHNRVGYVFRNRFKSEEICTHEYLLNCINYIHKNPVKAGLCAKEEDYVFSSYKDFASKRELFKCLPNSDKIFIDTLSEMNESCTELINTYLMFNKMKHTQLIKDKERLKELTFILYSINNIPSLEIARKLGIGRETVRKIVKELKSCNSIPA